MRHIELPPFKENDFKVGDRMHLYAASMEVNDDDNPRYVVSKVEKDRLQIENDRFGNYWYHFNQCRKVEEVLKQIEPRVWLVSLRQDTTITSSVVEKGHLKYIKVREILEE